MIVKANQEVEHSRSEGLGEEMVKQRYGQDTESEADLYLRILQD